MSHVLIEATGAGRDAVADRATAEALIAAVVDAAELTPVAPITVVEFPASARHPYAGVTAFQVLGESHVAYHSFAEKAGGAFALDVYTCVRDRDLTQDVVAAVRRVFGDDVLVDARALPRTIRCDE